MITEHCETRPLLNGRQCEGDGGERPVFSLATGAQIASICDSGFEQIEAATRAAREAFSKRAMRTPAGRAAHLGNFALDVLG